MSGRSDGLEIERKWLLHRLPERLDGGSATLDPQIEELVIRQGYLSAATDSDFQRAIKCPPDPDDPPQVGRIRANRCADGTTRFEHTLKLGSGLVRRELERHITAEAFDAAWPGTLGRRLEKTRWRIREAGFVWEVDRLEQPAVVLAEVEAPDQATVLAIQPPEWLACCIDREVTSEPAFSNAELAFQQGLLGGDPNRSSGPAND
ncbi:MAG: hypothetical protein O3A19_05165 [Planctomycetota bacterium]|nr:hypothetical protein [Planctomycetota bacterium]MDA1025799.1 hypothetical protein [Planctomycetota bacterium]